LHDRIVGQDPALDKIVHIYETYRSGMINPGRPIANILLVGPTGVGKTRVVESCAEIFFTSPNAMIKLDCGEFQHSHEIAKLIGSPPGYLGHRETSPLLTEDRLTQFQTQKNKFCIILWDEIEKASDALWNLLLGILDKGSLTLGDNRRVDMCNTINFMTTNQGAREVQARLSGEGSIGFTKKVFADSQEVTVSGEKELNALSMRMIHKKFTPEFMNRLDDTIFFSSLTKAQCREIVKMEIALVQERILKTSKGATCGPYFALKCNESALDFLVEKGYSAKYNARNIKRTVQTMVVDKLSGIMATGQIPEDKIHLVTVELERNADSLSFFCQPLS
jgi:ATP-dependent Clp protease ATP-binding subunit ClpA